MNKPDILYSHRIIRPGQLLSHHNSNSQSQLANESSNSILIGLTPPTIGLAPQQLLANGNNNHCNGNTNTKSFHKSTPLLLMRGSPQHNTPSTSSSSSSMFYPTGSKSFTSTYNTVVSKQQPGDPTPSILNVPVGVGLNSVDNKSDLSLIFSQMARINDHLYLSSLMAITPDRLNQYGISLVVSAIGDLLPGNVKAPGIANLHVQVEDVESANLRVHFDRVSDRIHHEYKRGGRALVHCMAGVSRSSSLILAYLMKYQGMSLAKAYHHVKSIRPFINPNRGFWKQLLDYEYHLHNEQTVNLISHNNNSLYISNGNSILSHSRNRQYSYPSVLTSTTTTATSTGNNLPILCRRPSISANRRLYSHKSINNNIFIDNINSNKHINYNNTNHQKLYRPTTSDHFYNR